MMMMKVDTNLDSSSARTSLSTLNVCGLSRCSPADLPDGKGHPSQEDERVTPRKPTSAMIAARRGSQWCAAPAKAMNRPARDLYRGRLS
jgi:hypothetical protein